MPLGGGELRAELAGGEVVEGTEAAGELGVGQAALAVELAQMIRGGAFAFQRVAFHTSQHQVAIGIASVLRARHNVIEATLAGAGPSQAIKTQTTLPRVNGPAPRGVLEEIQLFEVGRGLPRKIPTLVKIEPEGANLAW